MALNKTTARAVSPVARNSRGRPRAMCLIVAVVLPCLLLARAAGAAPAGQVAPRPIDRLLRLVPADAAFVLTVEGLREQARAFAASRLAADLQKLPAVKAWFSSEKYRKFEQSRAHLEALVGARFADLRDELLGDAVVLALRLPPEAPADSSQARGLLLFQARDHALLKRLIDAVNAAQQDGGELARVGERQRSGTTYHIREFPEAAARLSESYVAYPDGTFAFSNSERLIHEVIDRKSSPENAAGSPRAAGPTRGEALSELPRFKEVQRALPDGAFVRLYVDPRTFERLIASSPRPAKPSDANLLAMIERYVSSVRYAGAALVWGEKSIVLHAVETLEPSRLDPWIVRWAGDDRKAAAAHATVPPTAVAVARTHVDFAAVWAAIARIVPEQDQPKLANLEAVLTGVLLGQDLRSKILPRLGPDVFAYVDSPASPGEANPGGLPASVEPLWPLPIVLVVPISDDTSARVRSGSHPGGGEAHPGVPMAGALENALHTALAMTAMDDKRHQGRSRIVTHQVNADTSVTTLDPPIPFAYAVDRAGSRLILSTSARSIARYLEVPRKPDHADRFQRLRAGALPGEESFFCVDLDLLGALAARHRNRLVKTLANRNHRPVADVESDLTQVLALARMFEAAFVAAGIDRQATMMHQSAGLILHDSGAAVPRP